MRDYIPRLLVEFAHQFITGPNSLKDAITDSSEIVLDYIFSMTLANN